MSTSVVTSPPPKPAAKMRVRENHDLEQALVALESVCLTIQEGEFTHGREDEDRHYWQQKLKNLTTPISLALAECKGPRHFHNYYRHRENETDALQPTAGPPPLQMLAYVCDKALHACEDMVGAKGSLILENKSMLERALRRFLAVYENET